MSGSKRRSVADRLRKNVESESKLQVANKRMASKLMELLENDKIWDDYDKEFIPRVHQLLNQGKTLSANQEAHLEKCFHHKY